MPTFLTNFLVRKLFSKYLKNFGDNLQPAITFSKLTIKISEQGVKYVQS